MKMMKTVLVTMGENSRPVSFTTSLSAAAVTDDTKALEQAIRVKFKDILQPGQEFFMQLESDKWGGKFLDVLVDQEVADQSVVKIVMKPMSHVSKLEKVVLVGMGEHKRPVKFSTVITDKEALTQAVQVTFDDILQPGQKFFLQLESKKWGGRFVDLLDSQEVADRSVVKAVIESVKKTSLFLQPYTVPSQAQPSQPTSAIENDEQPGVVPSQAHPTQQSQEIINDNQEASTFKVAKSDSSSSTSDDTLELALPSEVLLEDTNYELRLCSKLDLRTVLETLFDARTKWYNIGLKLRLPEADLAAIEAENRMLQDCLREVLAKWLRGVNQDSKPTWKRLADALRSPIVQENQLAKFVEEKYCNVGEYQVARVNYSDYLRHLYRDFAPVRMLQWPKLPHYEFVSLAMIKRKRLGQGKLDKFVELTLHGCIDDITQQKEEIDLKIIFDKIEAEHKVILLEGAPGAGKTMLIWHICHEWGRKKLFTQFSIIVLATLRDPEVQKAKSITDVLALTCENRRDAEKVAARMRACHGRDILFLLDGWDELPEEQRKSKAFLFSELIEKPIKHSLEKAAIIVTSRPVSSGDLRPFVSSRIEIVGFIASKIKEYFKTCLKSEEGQAGALDKLLQIVEDNPLIESICYLPLNAAIVVYLFCACGYTLPSTYHELFQLLVYHCILRHIDRSNLTVTLSPHQHPSFDNFPEELSKPFEEVCKLAYHATRKNVITFSSAILCDFGVTDPLNHLGLMQTVKSLLIHGEGTTYHFLHLSLQELLAAYHISKMTPDSQLKVFNEMLNEPRFSAVFGFYAGFTKLQNKEIRDVVAAIVQTERQNSADKTLLVSLMNWLYEAQDIELCHFVQGKLTSEKLNEGNGVLDLSYTSLKPSDALSVGYFMSTVKTESGKHFCVDLSNCRLEDHHAKFLVKGLSHCQPTTTPCVEINLFSNNFGAEGINHIADFLKESQLIQALILRKNKLTYSRLLETLVKNSSLIELDISQCALTVQAGESVTALLANNRSLQSLDISSCMISPECIADGLKQNSALKTLHMIYCNVTAEGMRQISEAIKLCHLEELSVGPLLDNCMEPLAIALTTLRSLSLRGEQITNKGLHILGEALEKSKSLHKLYLQDFHCVTSEGLSKLGEQLEGNQTLEELTMINFRDSSIMDGLRNFVNCFQTNCTLKLLKLSEDQVKMVKEIVRNINKNRKPSLKLKEHT